MRQKQSTRVNLGVEGGQGCSQSSPLRSVHNKKTTDRQKSEKDPNISAIALEVQMHCISNFISNYTLPILVQRLLRCFVFSFSKCTVGYVLVFVSAFVSALDMYIILALYKEIYCYYYYILLLLYYYSESCGQ